MYKYGFITFEQIFGNSTTQALNSLSLGYESFSYHTRLTINDIVCLSKRRRSRHYLYSTQRQDRNQDYQNGGIFFGAIDDTCKGGNTAW